MSGRDSAGRFQPGNPGGPGRPRRDSERRYLDATIAAVGLDDWREIVRKAVLDAKAGDSAARTWLSKILIPDPQVFELEERLAELEVHLSLSPARNGTTNGKT